MNNFALKNFKLSHWMASDSIIETLALGDLILPGAHNSGVDKKATYAAPGVAHWVACQSHSFYEQMRNGARAIDARIEYHVDSRGVGTFWFQHAGIRSSRSLENLIMQVIRFLEESPDEFVLLDFHELKSGNVDFDHREFGRFLLMHLGQRVIPSSNRHLNLGQLKQASHVQRVWLAANRHEALDPAWFLQRIEHRWSGIEDTSVVELENHIARTLQAPPIGSMPWSLSATSYSIALGPVDIKEHLDRWFDPESGNWVFNCSIINADFFEESRLVHNCRAANIIKAQRRTK
ncbi:phospholipase [Pseudomonas laurylsulfativorans]|uniref:Phospholipase n=1 Tax=Pseudomonas laurylsulfativorans TaxID=1943631 RepID=A0A2S3VUQ1_9PSED|nr:phospholipase [Pseudomonas laurylsulfativorans]POF43667.1 phospholipase [Pseudomonas laurylsulfativorans]